MSHMASVALIEAEDEMIVAAGIDVEAGYSTSESAILSGRDESYLVSLIEEARPIIRRPQFFLWARGALQSVIPHEVLICGYGDWRRRAISVDRFSSKPYPEPMYADLCNADDGLLVQAYSVWEGAGHTPVLVTDTGTPFAACAQFHAILQRHGIENCVIHGVPQVSGGLAPFYCFAGLPQPLTRHTVHLIELVIPVMYAAHLRLLHNERRRSEPKAAARSPARARVSALPKPITSREVHILQWVQEGKSNREIAEGLELSSLTVKNHVQNILKKLKVRNRAQAVSRAIGLRLIKSNNDGNVSQAYMARTAHIRAKT